MRRALVIGYGSIGKRHAQTLARAGFLTSIVSRRPLDGERRFATVKEALEDSRPDLAVICNETSLHRASLGELEASGYQGPVLVEKPLWQPQDAAFNAPGIKVSVGYVLRFHPVLMHLKSLMSGRRALCAEVRCASYLPDWRPGTDYRETESAKLAQGGGVLRDLSHEIDYAGWLFGDFRRVAALGGRFSGLEIETDDSFAILAEAANCSSVAISINYLGRPTSRGVIVNMDEGTYCADLTACAIELNGQVIFKAPPFDRNTAFAMQHAEAMAENPPHLAGQEDGLKTIRYIGAIETASLEQRWVRI
jgi:predicted dehydrogenase